MLIRFSVENFRSFKERQELSLVASSLEDLPEATIDTKELNHKLLRVAAIYGANASGKTNILKALGFVSHAVGHSQRSWAPDDPIDRSAFRLNDSESRPSSFEVEFLLGGVRYRYEFSLDSRRIIAESLSAYPQRKEQVWFKRSDEGGETKFRFGRNLSGENQSIKSLTRPNSLFLSAAAQSNHAMLLPIYKWLVDGLRYRLRSNLTFADIKPKQCVRIRRGKTASPGF